MAADHHIKRKLPMAVVAGRRFCRDCCSVLVEISHLAADVSGKIHVYVCYISQVLELLEDACEGLLSHIESLNFLSGMKPMTNECP